MSVSCSPRKRGFQTLLDDLVRTLFEAYWGLKSSADPPKKNSFSVLIWQQRPTRQRWQKELSVSRVVCRTVTRLRADSSGACCFCIRVTAVARFTACLPALTIDSSPDPRRRRVCCRLALGMWWWWGFFWCLSQEALFDFCYQSSSESCVLTWDEPHSHFCLLNISVILFLYSAFMQTRVFCEYDINVTTVWIQHLDSVCLLENLRGKQFFVVFVFLWF